MTTSRQGNSRRTKAQLQAELDAANERTAALLDLIDAINEATYAAPVGAAGVPCHMELRRAWSVLGMIRVATDRHDRISPESTLGYDDSAPGIRHEARHLRKSITEPAGYEAYAPRDESEPAEGEAGK